MKQKTKRVKKETTYSEIFGYKYVIDTNYNSNMLFVFWFSSRKDS